VGSGAEAAISPGEIDACGTQAVVSRREVGG